MFKRLLLAKNISYQVFLSFDKVNIITIANSRCFLESFL